MVDRSALTPENLFWALLLSVPVGVGVSVGVMRMTGGGFLTPIVSLPGLVTAVAIFAFVLLTLVTGDSVPE